MPLKPFLALFFLLAAFPAFSQDAALTLEDFPAQYTAEHGFTIVVGLDAMTIDTVSAERLLAYLRYEEAKKNISVPTARGILDADALAGAQNYLVVGGPCVNRVAFALLGRPAECAKGFREGRALIQLFETGEYHALLIAGYSGVDTQRTVEFVIRYQMPNATRLVINTRTLEILQMG